MNGTHPHTRRAAAGAIHLSLALLAFSGCQTHPTAMTNPFASPDRVPPPATRTLLPGQASPYYQGDPLPSLQSAQPQQPVEGASLAKASEVPPQPSPAREMSPAIVSESAIRIPNDDAPLRADPPPRPEIAKSEPRMGAAPGVTLASFNQAVPAATTPSVGAFESAPNEAADPSLGSVTSPAPQPMWRSPGIARANPQVGVASPTPSTWPNYAPGPVAPALFPNGAQGQPIPMGPNIGVRMRAVPSPQLPPAETATPRIRLPGYTSPTTPPAGVEQAGYYMGQPSFAQVQTLPITPVQAVVYNPPVVGLGTVASGDGFRPRGSMR
jgi:hypothetical protein